ncbi:MAG: glycosyltransferase family 4 protein [Candidatus Sulfotelmatobacter sp.]
MSKATKRKGIRVVHLTSAHGPFDVRIFHKECRSLARAGYEVIEIGNFDFNGAVDGVTIRGLNRRGGRLQRSTINLVPIAREAIRAAGDLYHLHDPELLLVGLLLRAAGKLVVYDIHEDLPRTVLFKAYLPQRVRKPLMWAAEFMENMLARQMSGLIAATPALAERFGRFKVNTIAVNNYVILDEFKPRSGQISDAQPPGVTYYGGMSTERGIHELLAAMALLPQQLGVKLELAGTFYVQEQQKSVMGGAEWQHVLWHGEIGRADLASLLRRVQVGLVVLHPHPAYLNSHPTKLFEYMAAGIPVVASDFPLWRSIIENADCGLLVDPFDPSAIAAAIEYLITNPDEANRMGMRGRRAVERQFNWDMEEQSLLSFYGSLLPDRAAIPANPAMA